jgi:nucleotide-binding universal stress UspA family protein
MHTKILIPLDGSERAEAAVDEALELITSAGAVHLMVVDTAALQMRQLEGFTLYVDQYREIRKQSGIDYLRPFKEKIEAAGGEVTTSVAFGDPVPVIAKEAGRRGTDLILLGGSGGGWLERHTGLAKYAPRLAKRVSATVLTVLPKDRAAKEKAAKEKLAPAA